MVELEELAELYKEDLDHFISWLKYGEQRESCRCFEKNEQAQLLRRDLIKMPEHNSEHAHEYITPENLIITVTTKTKNRRNYIFGGPIWCAIVNFSDEKKLKVNFLSPLKKPYSIEWVKVNEITLHFIFTGYH